MNMLKRASLFMVVLAMLTMMIAITPVSAAETEAVITLTGPDAEVNVGDEIEVSVDISTRYGLMGAQVKVTWDPAYLSMSAESVVDPDTEETSYPAFSNQGAIFGKMFDLNLNDVANGSVTFGGAKTGNSAYTGSTPMTLGVLHFTVLEAAAGKKIEIGYDVSKTYANTGDANVPFAGTVGTSVKVAGGEPEVPTAATIGLTTAEGKELQNVAVKNNNGSEYVINSALAFVSCVDTDKAEPVKTVITREGSDKELVIAADSKTEIGSKTYFVAAVSSIKDSSFGKVFTAKAFAKAVVEGVEYEVAGDNATGIYDAE